MKNRSVRPFIAAVALLTACRSKQPVPPAPAVQAVPVAQPETEEVAADPAPMPVLPREPARTAAPTDAEVHAVLDRSFAGFGACFAAVPSHTTKPPYLLRFTVAPTGKVVSVGVDGLTDAQHCVFDVFAGTPFPAWRGAAMPYTLPLGADGRPATAAAATDGG